MILIIWIITFIMFIAWLLWNIFCGIRELRKTLSSPLPQFNNQSNNQIQQPYKDEVIKNIDQPASRCPPSSKIISLCVNKQYTKNRTAQAYWQLQFNHFSDKKIVQSIGKILYAVNKYARRKSKNNPSNPRIFVDEFSNNVNNDEYDNRNGEYYPKRIIVCTSASPFSRHILRFLLIFKRILRRLK